jgi:hypothetical protein
MDKRLEKLKELAIINNNEIQDPEFNTLLEASAEYIETINDTYLMDEIVESSPQNPEEEAIVEYITNTIEEKKIKATKSPLTPEPSPTPAARVKETPSPEPARTKPPLPTPTLILTKTPPPDLDQIKKVDTDGSYSVFHNDDDGTCYKVEYYDDNDSLVYYIEYVYRYDGKIIGVVKKDSQGNILD